MTEETNVPQVPAEGVPEVAEPTQEVEAATEETEVAE